MKILLFVMFFISTIYSQDIIPLDIGNKWSYEYYHYRASSSGSSSENYLMEKEVVGDTLLSDIPYSKIRVKKIEEGVSSFIRYEYWNSDSLIFRHIGMDRLSNISKIFDLTLSKDSIGIDYFVGSEETIVMGENVLVQRFRYTEGGMANIDTEVETARNLGVTHIYEDGSVDTGGSTWWYDITLFEALINGRTITSIEKKNNIHTDFILKQNYPNPFNPSTTIGYSLHQSGFVKLKVYDVLGREVASLVNKEQSVGNYEAEFNASNLTSGIYFYKLQSGNFMKTKKLILLR